LSQPFAPAAAAVAPVAQATQFLAPEAAAYVPVPQLSQVVEPALAVKVPAAQAAQAVAPVDATNVPAEQAKQTVFAPAASWYAPAPQLVHLVEPSGTRPGMIPSTNALCAEIGAD